MSLYLKTVIARKGNREDILNGFRVLGNFDYDFNGMNDYLWDEAAGFDSNMEYLIHEVKDIPDDETCINTFFDRWMAHDDDYYHEHALKILERDQFLVISFAATHDD